MKKVCWTLLFSLATMVVASEEMPIVDLLAKSEEIINVASEDEDRIQAEMNIPGFDTLERISDWVYIPSTQVIYPIASHWIFVISSTFDSIELEDGSVWNVKPRDVSELKKWMAGDAIVITPNHNLFSRYNYRILNKNQKTSIAVNLSQGPLAGGSYSRMIIRVDQKNGIVTLSDYSTWDVVAKDYSAVSHWTEGDLVITGANSGWIEGSPLILINASSGQYVRANSY